MSEKERRTGDGYLGNALVLQAWGAEFNPQSPRENAKHLEY